MKSFLIGILLVLFAAVMLFAQAPAGQTAADLRLRTERFSDKEAKAKYTVESNFPYFKDRILKMRDMDTHQNNVEAIWEKIGEK